MGLLDFVKFVREKEVNIAIWLVSIIQSKAAMNGFEQLVAVEKGDNIWFGATNNEKYDGYVVFMKRMGNSVKDCYLSMCIVALVKTVYDEQFWKGNSLR